MNIRDKLKSGSTEIQPLTSQVTEDDYHMNPQLHEDLEGIFMQKLTQEEAEKIFKDGGCELIGEYVDSHTPVEYRCSCGNIAKIRLGNFQQGQKCKNCGIKKRSDTQRYTQEEAEQIFINGYCRLLDKYIGRQIPVIYQCSCGRIAKITLGHFQSGQRCKECGYKKISEKRSCDKSNFWNSDRDAVEGHAKFRVKCKNMIHRCCKAFGTKKEDHFYVLVGYTSKDYKIYIENHPSFKNVDPKNFHIDHIFPIKAFTDYGIKDVALANCLENLQPLTPEENCNKKDKYNKEEFERWLTQHNWSI